LNGAPGHRRYRPVNYLILIGHIDLLPPLFEKVILPTIVRNELASRKAPPAVQEWIAEPQAWLEVRDTPLGVLEDLSLKGIDADEKAAIQLAVTLHADLLLMDDRRGVIAAEGRGLLVTGTLDVPDLAAERGLVDLGQMIKKLERTTFHRPEALLNALLEKTREGRRS
jgi:predicted nucleic acid-binding protein